MWLLFYVVYVQVTLSRVCRVCCMAFIPPRLPRYGEEIGIRKSHPELVYLAITLYRDLTSKLLD